MKMALESPPNRAKLDEQGKPHAPSTERVFVGVGDRRESISYNKMKQGSGGSETIPSADPFMNAFCCQSRYWKCTGQRENC